MAGDGIAIVGMSVLLPGASDLGSYWNNLIEGVDAIRDVPPGRLDPVFFDEQVENPGRFYCRRGGFVDDDALFDPLSFGIMPVVVDAAEPDQMIALRVASEALRDIGPSAERVDRTRVGVILGRGGYLTQAQSRLNEWVRTAEQVVTALRGLLPELSEAQLDEVRQRFQQSIGPRRPEAAIGIVPNLAASRIANRLDFSGPAYLVDAACASSLIAVDHAVRELEAGRCDLVLAGGVHHCHDTTLWSVFTQLRAVSPTQQIRPFDRRADGLLIGEGTGIVALKRLADAERDGDRIYAVVRGTGLASDGRESALMNPSVSGQVLALERAWRAAGVDPKSIGLIEAHGTATPAGDEAELRTLAQFFGPAENGKRAGLGSVKSMIGHAMPAAGVAGLVKAALAVHHGVLPPTLHCEEPLPLVEQTRFRPLATAEPWTTQGTPRRAGVNAFGFGGVNAHVVLESHASATGGPAAARGSRAAATAAQETESIWLFAAESTQDLLAQLERARAAGAAPPLGAARGPVRLAIAGPDAKRIDMARRAVERGAPWRGRGDIWFATQGLLASGGKIAFLFPGVEPVAVPALDDVAEHFGLPAPEHRGADLERHGYAVIQGGRLLDRVLRGLGVAPDMIAGHSIGEWTGMVAAEVVPPAEVENFIDSLERHRLVVPDVVYLAMGCNLDTTLQVIDDMPDVALSHDNCPHQTIVCGRPDAIERVRERLRERRVLSEELSFRSGFHSRFFAPHLEHYAETIDSAPLQRRKLPMWSATTCELYPEDPAEIRALVRRFYVEPVRFRPLLQRLHREGVRAFVQIGIGSLANFVSDTLRSEEHLGISLLERGRSGLAQLRRAAAALFVEGAGIALERVFPAGEEAPVQATARRGGKLVLGSNLVRFAEPLALARSAAPPTPNGVPAGALHAEFEAVLRQATEASREVAELFGRGRAAAADGGATRAASEPRELRERRRLSLRELPAMIDHTLYPQPDDCDPSDRFPVVPMTAMIEMMGEVAQRLVPGRTVVGYEKVTALRWLAIEPPVDIEVQARFDGVDRVQVTLDRYARCTVRLAHGYPEADSDELEPLIEPHPCPVQASDFYHGRWMFHGPHYQGVVALGPLGDNGMHGTLRTQPALGALLDNAGQLMGFWVLVNTQQDRFAFPFTIDRIDFFAPEPPIGTIVECEVRIDSVTESAVRARMELRVGERLLARVRGWEDRRFESTERSWEVFMRASTSLLAETDSRPYAVAREHWRTSAGRELMMRRYLGAAEREEYWNLDLNAQREWLLARIAIKDAVRRWLWDRGHGPIFPLQIQVRGKGKDDFEIRGPFDEDLRVAVAHQRGIAVALLSVGTRPHIEIGASAGGDASLESRQESSFVVSWSGAGR
jgi:3-oxoacyl-(acyl-carrier-protein) synthase